MGIFTSTLLITGLAVHEIVAAFQKHRRKSVIVDVGAVRGAPSSSMNQVLVLDRGLPGIDKYEGVRKVLTDAFGENTQALVAYTSIHDDDVLILFVTNRTEVVEEYISNPAYFGVEDSEITQTRGGQNWRRLAAACECDGKAEQLRDLMHPQMQDAFVFESDRLSAISDLLSWPGDLLTSLTYADFDEDNSEIVAHIPVNAVYRTGVRRTR